MLSVDEESVVKSIKALNTGSSNVNKDYLSPIKSDSFVKRGINSVSIRSVVIWTSFIPAGILAVLENGNAGP